MQTESERLIQKPAVARTSDAERAQEAAILAQLKPGAVMMMGDNPGFAPFPKTPKLLDFYRLRFGTLTQRHLLQSAKLALEAGQSETVVTACLLHDIAVGGLMGADHGYWGAQLIAPYVSEEVAWAVRAHQALRYYPDETVGYRYPDAYRRYFGPDYQPPDYIRKAYEAARAHRWYMTARLITVHDVYAFEEGPSIDPEIFTDIIGRNVKEPEAGFGFDDTPVTQMWRTMIWPNNFL
jgi:hypothetical protein